MTPIERVVAAARAVHEARTDTYRAGNNRQVGIQGDDGEKCFIVHSDQMFELEQSLSELDASDTKAHDDFVFRTSQN